jgi:hypothetical protein
MGHEIVYCVRCATRIAGTDFEKAKAFRLSGRAICAACLPELLPTLTPAEQQELSLSSTKMRVVKEQQAQRASSLRLPTATRQDAPPPSRTGMIVGFFVGALVLVGGILAMMLRSSPEPATRPAEPPPVVKPTSAPAPAEDRKEDAQIRTAREAVEAARAKAKAAPEDLEGQLAAWEDAARKAALTPFFREATAAVNELKDKKSALKPLAPVKKPDPPVVAPPVDPVVKPPSAELKAYLARWESAMARASAQDFDGAIADLGRAAAEIPDEGVKNEARADGALLQRARGLRVDGLAALSRLSRGQTVGIEARNDAGQRKQIEGTIVRAANGRAELRQGEETVWVEAEDLTAGSLALLVGPRTDEDLRAFAVLCLLEGDRDAAERLASDVPERYRDIAKTAATRVPKTPARELEARRRFYAAEREFAKPDTLAAAVAKYKSLAEDYADTSVVKSEGPRIRKRMEAGRDYVFVAGALKATGTFGLSQAPRTEVAWVSKAGVDGNKETLENFVEAEFTALPDTTYRCWALVAGCCAETFTFYLQSTEAMETHPKTKQKVSIDPGAEMAATVRPAFSNLKKTHEEHKIKGAKVHPKTPARWEWVTIPLPKYSAAGAKKVRLISDQQGFGVGAIVVSSTRTATMSDPELKEEVARVRAAYAAAQEGLVGWWRLDEGAGTTVSDSVEGGHSGLLTGAPKWAPGKVGGALKCEGADQVLINGAYSFSMITLAAWVKHDGGFDQKQQRYITVGANETAVLRCETGGIHFYIRTNNELRQIVLPGTLEQGKWIHVAGTWDGTTMKVYKDGALLQSAQPGGTLTSDVKFILLSMASEPMKGLLDDARVYNRALSETEIKKLVSDGTAGAISEISVEPPQPAGKPWRPLFDGSTVNCLRGVPGSWRVESGALAYIPGTDDAAQTREDFGGDGELRIRFEVKDAERLWFVYRQGTGGWGVDVPQLKSLEGKPHELVFAAKGDQVTATLDGKPLNFSTVQPVKSGCLQFNGRGRLVRILSMDVR